MTVTKTKEIERKKEWAKTLYLRGDLLQKEIAEKVGIAEKTLSKWIKDNNWESLKTSLLTTKAEQLQMLYSQLKSLNNNIKEKHDNIPDVRTADTIIKITASIKSLETETSVAEIIEVAQDFIKFVKQDNLDKAKEVTTLFDMYIRTKL